MPCPSPSGHCRRPEIWVGRRVVVVVQVKVHRASFLAGNRFGPSFVHQSLTLSACVHGCVLGLAEGAPDRGS